MHIFFLLVRPDSLMGSQFSTHVSSVYWLVPTKKRKGVMRESNSRPPAPEAGIIPLDQSPSIRRKKGRAGVEPATYRAATDCSTTELTPHHCYTLRETSKKKIVWRSRVSIPVHPACKAGALPFELHPHQQHGTRKQSQFPPIN